MTTPWPPATRTTDPPPSHDAEARVTRTGRRQSHAERLRAYVVDHPGLTSRELGNGRLAGIDRYAAARRLADLQTLAMVRKGGERQVQGRMHSTWWPVDTQGALALGGTA